MLAEQLPAIVSHVQASSVEVIPASKTKNVQRKKGRAVLKMEWELRCYVLNKNCEVSLIGSGV